MRGALLRSDKSEAFTALGETGQPVYRAALQLREAIRRKHPQMVDHLAIPQSDELGNKIDWYSGIEGDVIPWSAATEEERAPARVQLEALKTALEELSNRFLGADPAEQQGDKAVFGKLLKRVIHFPDENFVYLVNGKPVLTFWGFEHADADRSLEPLHCLYPQAEPLSQALPPQVAPPVFTPPEPLRVRQPWWRRWWWLLPLLLLLLLLLLLGLRSCAPNVTLPGLPSAELPNAPNLNLPSVAAGNATGLNSAVGPGTGRSENPVAAVPSQTEAEPEPASTPSAPAAEKPQAPEPAAAPPEPESAPAPGNPKPPAPLSIPPDAQEGVADFLNGHYRAGAGIQDKRTGKPLRLEYQFKDGKGDVTVRQANGISCSGPVTAAMKNGSLSIDSNGQAACADGSNYDMPKINCLKGAQSVADCTGGYGNEQFPLSMRQTGE